MPMPSFPASTLLASKWKSLAKDHDKKLGIGDKLDDLETAYRGLVGAYFGMVKPDTAAATQRALAEMDAAAGKGELRKAIDAARAASAYAKSKGAELQKKEPPTYKLLAPQLDKIVTDAADWAKALEKEAAADRADMEKHLAKLKAQEAKQGGDEDEKDDGNVGKLVQNTKKLLLNEVRKYKPEKGEPSLFKFCMAWTGPKLVTLVRKRSPFNEAFKALLAPQLGAPKAEGFTNGEVIWDEEKKSLVFSCRGKIPAKAKVKTGLKEQVEKNFNVLLRKLVRTKDGQEKFEDVAEGAEDDATGAAPAGDPVAEFNAELNTLSPRMMKAVRAGGKPADDIKKLLAQASSLGKSAATAPKAIELLAQIEAIVDDVEEAAAAAPAPAPTAGGGAKAPDAAALDKLRKARAEWGTVRKAFHDEVADFVKWLDEIYREEPEQAKEIKRAKVELITAANKVTPELEKLLDAVIGGAASRKVDAKRTLGTIKTVIASDKIILAVDGNERNPGCKVVATMADRLRQLEAVLA